MVSAAEVRHAWASLTRTLERFAPRSLALIRPPRGDVDRVLDHAEATLGMSLGEDVRTFFSLHNGGDDVLRLMVLPRGGLVGPETAMTETLLVRSAWSSTTPGTTSALAGTAAHTWLPEYVVFSVDTSGNGAFVDLRDGPLRGCIRRWDKVDSDTLDSPANHKGPAAASVADALSAAAAAIAARRVHRDVDLLYDGTPEALIEDGYVIAVNA